VVEPVIFVNEILAVAPVATKEYQTSSSAVPPHGLASDEALAQAIVPLVTEEQDAPELIVKAVALEQLSLEGAPPGQGFCKQISKVVV
jgi:hypothetical protein